LDSPGRGLSLWKKEKGASKDAFGLPWIAYLVEAAGTAPSTHFPYGK
jgi:hypothetical protein